MDLYNHLSPLESSDLLSFTQQIASGMVGIRAALIHILTIHSSTAGHAIFIQHSIPMQHMQIKTCTYKVYASYFSHTMHLELAIELNRLCALWL